MENRKKDPNVRVIAPGFLVSLHSQVTGGLDYERIDLDTGKRIEGDMIVQRWETKKTITNAEDYTAAQKARAAAQMAIRKVCSVTPFGLLCPKSETEELDRAIREAREIADAYNKVGLHSRVTIRVLKGFVADNDVEAAKAVADEIRGMITEMDAAIASYDVERIREAAKAAKDFSGVLTPENKESLLAAVEAARAAATRINKASKKSEDIASALAEIDMSAIREAGVRFLDLSDSLPDVDALPPAEAQRFAGLDVDETDSGASPDVPAIPTLDTTDDSITTLAALPPALVIDTSVPEPIEAAPEVSVTEPEAPVPAPVEETPVFPIGDWWQ